MSQTQLEYFAANAKKSVDTGLYWIELDGKKLMAGSLSALERRWNRLCDKVITVYRVDLNEDGDGPWIKTMQVSLWRWQLPQTGTWFRSFAAAKEAVIHDLRLGIEAARVEIAEIRKLDEEDVPCFKAGSSE